MSDHTVGGTRTLDQVIAALAAGGAHRIYAKALAANDNSKNQIYLGGDFGILNTIPAGAPEPTTSGSHATPIFIASVNLHWLGKDGLFRPARHSKFILYPQYPEVRLSGFLRGCTEAPSALMGGTRQPGRLLVLGIRDDGAVLAWAGSHDGPANSEFVELVGRGQLERSGVLFALPLPGSSARTAREALLTELRRIHGMAWIESVRLGAGGARLPCKGQNCGGFTLEAELGIAPNGYSEPDFMGWEVKQHAVTNFERPAVGPITLMTPEPTAGVYATLGVIPFIRKYGYADKLGREDRRNFGGIHRFGAECAATGLTLTLTGFDQASGRITDAGGGIVLLDKAGEQAAGWRFKDLMAHWNRKHANAAYVPSMMRTEPTRQYRFGPSVRLGEGTDFLRFLSAVAAGSIYYDPGIKAESWSTKPQVKRRSQFRIKSDAIGALYHSLSAVTVA